MTLLLTLAALAGATHVRAQGGSGGGRFHRPRWRAELGAAVSTPYVKDASGPTVQAGVGPYLGGAAVWDAGDGRAVALFLRATRASVDLSLGGASWSGGSVTQLDLGGSGEQSVRGGWIVVRVAGDMVLLNGRDDVAPFRFGNNPSHYWGGEMTTLVRAMRDRPLYASLGLQAFRLGGNTVGNPISADGVVSRVMIGVRYGR
jgi:hypothetical protein